MDDQNNSGGISARLGRLFSIRGTPDVLRPARPKGAVYWLHAGAHQPVAALVDLASALLDRPDRHVLLTGAQAPMGVPRLLHDDLPAENTVQIAAFLDHWTPQAVLWADPAPHPKLLARIAQTPATRVAFDLPLFDISTRTNRRAATDALSAFDHVLARDAASATQLKQMGISAEISGPLQILPQVAPDTPARRAAIAARLATRPVWAAQGVTPDMVPMLVAAQVYARRTWPALVMLVVPAADVDPANLVNAICQIGLRGAATKGDASQARDLDAFVFEAPTDATIACRLAPVSVICTSLQAGGTPESPLTAANLGAAVLHGPLVSAFADAYAGLDRAGATRVIANPAALGAVLSEALRPDLAAQMATNAWDYLSRGADVIARLRDLVTPEPKKGP